MKFLQIDSLSILSSIMENNEICKDGVVLKGKVEGYSCKPVKDDRKTFQFLQRRHQLNSKTDSKFKNAKKLDQNLTKISSKLSPKSKSDQKNLSPKRRQNSKNLSKVAQTKNLIQNKSPEIKILNKINIKKTSPNSSQNLEYLQNLNNAKKSHNLNIIKKTDKKAFNKTINKAFDNKAGNKTENKSIDKAVIKADNKALKKAQKNKKVKSEKEKQNFHHLKLLSFMIEAFNLSYDEFDFRYISPSHFVRLWPSSEGEQNGDLTKNSFFVEKAPSEGLKAIRQFVDAKLEPFETADQFFRNRLWKAIDMFVPLESCDIYSFAPENEEENPFLEDSLWALNLFFIQKRHILFLSCVAKRGGQIV